MVCDLTIARVESGRLFNIGERFIPTILALINPGRDFDRLGIVRQRAPSDNQLVTYRIEVAAVNTDIIVIASQLPMSLPQIWTRSYGGLRRFLCQIEVPPRQDRIG